MPQPSQCHVGVSRRLTDRSRAVPARSYSEASPFKSRYIGVRKKLPARLVVCVISNKTIYKNVSYHTNYCYIMSLKFDYCVLFLALYGWRVAGCAIVSTSVLSHYLHPGFQCVSLSCTLRVLIELFIRVVTLFVVG